MVSALGFVQINNGSELIHNFSNTKRENRFFRAIHFRKQNNKATNSKIRYMDKSYTIDVLANIILESCSYKKR
jgi:hypothetical protein